jgi:hypothetical protein
VYSGGCSYQKVNKHVNVDMTETDLVLLCYLQLMVEKGLHMEKFQSVRVHVALSSSSPRMTQDLHDNNLNRA